jgi:hypothetical protein
MSTPKVVKRSDEGAPSPAAPSTKNKRKEDTGAPPDPIALSSHDTVLRRTRGGATRGPRRAIHGSCATSQGGGVGHLLRRMAPPPFALGVGGRRRWMRVHDTHPSDRAVAAQATAGT